MSMKAYQYNGVISAHRKKKANGSWRLWLSLSQLWPVAGWRGSMKSALKKMKCNVKKHYYSMKA
jgi:hypothetical protein